MRPSLSVIFFTVLSGTGYGLWCLLGVALAAGVYPAVGVPGTLAPLAFGFLLVTAGLLASTAHLGRPERAWRALSQWRSSWLSREGIAALLTYLPMLAVAALALTGHGGGWMRFAAACLAAGALATVLCTANIYRSLKTIPAWRTRQVVPLYFVFALLAGGTWLWAWIDHASLATAGTAFPLALVGLAAVAAVAKVDYWRGIDELPPATAGHATGLERFGEVRAFEAPTTGEGYLTREMAFVLARKHRVRLRRLAVALFAFAPGIGIALSLPQRLDWLVVLAGLACIAGLFVERWLFFAEARHAVAAYFPER